MLGEWLASSDEAPVVEHFQNIGRARYAEALPLAEVVYKIQLIELKIVEYIEYANVAQTAMEIFGEMEMLRALHRYFSLVIYGVIKGYEAAAKRAERRAAAAI